MPLPRSLRGFEATDIVKAVNHLQTFGLTSAFHPAITEHEMYGEPEAHHYRSVPASEIPSWLSEGYHRGQSVTLCLPG